MNLTFFSVKDFYLDLLKFDVIKPKEQRILKLRQLLLIILELEKFELKAKKKGSKNSKIIKFQS